MKIVLIGGSKQSGKTTAGTAIYGYHLTSNFLIPNAQFDENGHMSIVYKPETNEGIVFDIDNQDEAFQNFKNNEFGKYINHTSFADELKNTSTNLFGLDSKKIRGTNAEKNELTHIRWENVEKLISYEKSRDHDEYLTNREFLEIFGTDICRVIDPMCHIRSAFNKLVKLNPEIGLILDLRFENELNFFNNIPNVYKIRLRRKIEKSNKKSEIGLDHIPSDRFDLDLDNSNMSVMEKNQAIINFLIKVNVLNKNNVKVET